MELTILCNPFFSAAEEEAIVSASKTLNLSKEEVVREAVAFYSAQCVPTHLDATTK